MTKRILASMLAVVTTALCCSTSVYAAEPVKPGTSWVSQTYEDESSDYLAVDKGNLVVKKVTGEDGNTYAEVTALLDKPFCRIDMSSPVTNDFVVMIDLCKMDSPSLGWQFHVYTAANGQVRWAYKAADMEQGVWYTYLTIRKDGVVKHYRKIKGSEGEFEPITADNSLQISDGTNCLNITFWTPYGAEGGATYETTKFLADNIYFYNGSFAVPGTKKIEVMDVEGGKNISAAVDVYTDAELGEEMTVAPVMVVFDKKGKIMDWSPSTVTVGAAQNTAVTEITMTNDYYEKVKGGVAELYLWTSETSFKPMMNGYRVTLD